MVTNYRRNRFNEGRWDTIHRSYRAYGPTVGDSKYHRGAYLVTRQSTHMQPHSRTLDAINEDRQDRGEHPVLFHEDPLVLSHLFSDPEMSHTVPTLLGMAYVDSGGNMMSSHDLSQHSSRLTKKGLDRGLITPNPDNPAGNPKTEKNKDDVVFYESPEEFGEHVPDEDIRAARGAVRTALRGNKAPQVPQQPKPHLSEQFHPQLPGLEGL